MRWGVLLVIVWLGWVMPVYAQENLADSGALILINIPSRTLEYFIDNKLIKEYPIAVGKASTPTPVGEFEIQEKIVDPCWYPPEHPGSVVPSGPDNPLGYRWMGFSDNYGIHGTNMPWSIGMVTSSGCIRMQENDVEELFDLVTEGTTVRVTYDRIKVRVDQQGQASVGIYPDVYGCENITMESVQDKLATEGLGGLLDSDFVQQLIKEEADRQVEFARVHSLTVNNKRLTERLVSLEGKMYVPVLAVAASLKSNIYWDKQNQMVVGKQQAVPETVREGTLYVVAEQLQTLFGGRSVWYEAQNSLALQVPTLQYDGQLISSDILKINGKQFVPAQAIAEALGLRVSWDAAEQSFWVGMKKVPVTVIAGEPYIAVENMGEDFNVSTNWDDNTQILAMSYPKYAVDCSMYLEQMAPFL